MYDIEDAAQHIRKRLVNKIAMVFDSNYGGGRFETDNLLSWLRYYFPHYFHLRSSPLHEWAASRLMLASRMRSRHEVIEAARDSAKSTIGSFGYPLYAICEEREQYMILTSETQPQAKKFLEQIKEELVKNTKLRKDYPAACGKNPGEWNKTSIITRNGISVEAMGAGEKIRGRRYLQYRPSYISIDDPEGKDSARSKTRRDDCRIWILEDVTNAGSPTTNYFIWGTRLHPECATAFFSGLGRWKHLQFNSFMKWPVHMDMWAAWERIYNDVLEDDREALAKEFYETHKSKMLEGAVVLWPDREDVYYLMTKRAEGHNAFEAEKQNNPINPEDCEWPSDCFDDEDIWFDEWPEEYDVRVIACDPSKGKVDKSGDFQAIVMLCVSNGILYVDAELKKRPLNEMIEDLVNWTVDFKADYCVIESNQFQELIVEAAHMLSVEEKLLCPIEPIENYGTPKDTRIRKLGPYVSRGRVRYRRRSVGVRLLIGQLRDFPNADHDDGPDAFEMAKRRAAQALTAHRGRIDDPF